MILSAGVLVDSTNVELVAQRDKKAKLEQEKKRKVQRLKRTEKKAKK